jgi:AraC-like DNA-binding protein
VSPLLRELIAHAVSLDILDRRVDAQRRLMDVILDQLATLPVAAMNIPQPKDARAVKLASLLQANPGEPRGLAALAHVVGASPRTLERLFKADTGMSLGRWRQQLRLAHSLRLLAVGQPVTSVALDVGYDSPSAFVSSFRKTFGTTPGRYFRSGSG